MAAKNKSAANGAEPPKKRRGRKASAEVALPEGAQPYPDAVVDAEVARIAQSAAGTATESAAAPVAESPLVKYQNYRPEDYDAMIGLIRESFSGDVVPALEPLAQACLQACSTLELTGELVTALRAENARLEREAAERICQDGVELTPTDADLADEIEFMRSPPAWQ